MKLREVALNNLKKEFSVATRSGQKYTYPYARAVPFPSATNPATDLFVDKELASEAFTYVLRSGEEGSVHIEQILEFNEDPEYLADLLCYELSVEAQQRMETSKLSQRQVARRLGTSVPQLHRLLDPANTSKSLKQLIALLHVLGCDVDLVVKEKDVA